MVITDRPSTKYQNMLRWYETILVDILHPFQSDQNCMQHATKFAHFYQFTM